MKKSIAGGIRFLDSNDYDFSESILNLQFRHGLAERKVKRARVKRPLMGYLTALLPEEVSAHNRYQYWRV